MQLGNFIGPETIAVEYKEHRIHSTMLNSLILDKSIADYLDGIDEFTIEDTKYKNSLSDDIKLPEKISHIFETHYLLHLSYIALIKTIEKYIARYTVAFGNTTTIPYGELYIGISDAGEIIGIPIQHECKVNNYKIIIDKIKEEISKNIIINSYNQDCTIETFINKIDIEITEVDTSTYINFGYTIDKYLEEKNKEIAIYKKLETSYRTQYTNFISNLQYYKRPINIMINIREIRNDIYEFINIHKDEIDETTYITLTSSLLNEENIIFESGEIMKFKPDKNHMAYWITRFRDEKLNYIIENKPTRSYYFKPIDPYYHILRDFRPLVHKFAKDNIDIIIIKIKFPSKQSLDNIELLYNNNGNPQKFYRSLDHDGEPCCLS